MVVLRSNRPVVYPAATAFGDSLTVRENDGADAPKPRYIFFHGKRHTVEMGLGDRLPRTARFAVLDGSA